MHNSKQRKRNEEDRSGSEKPQTVARPRTTVFLPDALEANLDIAAFQTGRPKADIIRDALAEYLREKLEMEPYIRPKITISYAP